MDPLAALLLALAVLVAVRRRPGVTAPPPDAREARTQAVLAGLPPTTAAVVRLVLDRSREAIDRALPGWTYHLTSGIRTQAEQAAIYRQGRTDPGLVVTQVDGITQTSAHQDGRAVDAVAVDPAGDASWNAEVYAWWGDAAEAAGLVWGGRWSWPDRPHVEVPRGQLPLV